MTVQAGERFTELLRKRDSAALNAYEHERGTLGVCFGNLMRHPAPGAPEIGSFQYNAFVRHGGGHKKSRACALARESNAELIRFVSSTLAASQDRIKGRSKYYAVARSAWRRLRHCDRWFTIQSVSASSNPISAPAFSDSSHLCRMISSRSARNSR